MKCPKCKNNLAQMQDRTTHYHVTYLCLRCGCSFAPYRIPEKLFMAMENDFREHRDEVERWLAEKKAEVARKL